MMKIAALCLSLSFLVACSDSPKSVASDTLGLFEEVVESIEEAKGEGGPQELAKAMKNLEAEFKPKFEALAKRAKEVGEDKVKEALSKDYAEEMQAIMGRFVKALGTGGMMKNFDLTKMFEGK